MSKILLVTVLATFSFNASAALVISDVSYTSNSVTFSIDGDFSGYATPADTNRFSIVYGGDIFDTSVSYTPHTISGDFFDNVLIAGGNTGTFSGSSYSWFSSNILDISSGIATNNTVTVNMGDDYLDPLAINPVISFYWGLGKEVSNATLIYTTASAVPVPAAIWLFGSGLGLLGWMRRKA